VVTCGPMSAKRKSAGDEVVDGDATLTKIKKKILQIYRDLYHEILSTLTRSQRGEYYVCCTTCSTDFSCSHVGKITAKDTSSLKLTRNLVLYKNLTDLYQVFLPNRRQRLIIREQSPGLKF
jgi:hypothetical protein